jgi:hypothetical protein
MCAKHLKRRRVLGSVGKVALASSGSFSAWLHPAPSTIKPISPASPSLPAEKTARSRADGGLFRQSLLLALVAFLMCNPCHGARAEGSSVQQSRTQARRALSSPSSFTRDMAFGQATNILRNAVHPPLPIIVLWKDLDRNADIDRHTPIGMEGVSGVSLYTHLDLLLLAVSADSPTKLDYTVNNGVIIIATQGNLPIRRSTHVYDIGDIMSRRFDIRLPLAHARLLMALPLLRALSPF